jgi:hypothetical protein
MAPTSYTRMHKVPAADAVPITAFPTTVVSRAITVWHVSPFQVPRLSPMAMVLFGLRLLRVAVTDPDRVVANEWVAAPFRLIVPEKSWVVGVVDVGSVTVVARSSLHPAVSTASRIGTVKWSGINRRMSLPVGIVAGRWLPRDLT